jgi:hypothetical protein
MMGGSLQGEQLKKYFTISIIASEIWPDMRSVFGSEWHYKRGYCITTYINTNQTSNSKRYTVNPVFRGHLWDKEKMVF